MNDIVRELLLTPGQMVRMGWLVENGKLIEPDSDELEKVGRWKVQETWDGDIRVRDVERDWQLTPGGGIR